MSARDWLHQSYGIKQGPISKMLRTNPAYQGVMAPTSLDVRYIHEDVPTGLVPLEVFGNLFQVETPLISSIINLANAITGKDFRTTGRTLQCMGIAGMTPSEFIHYVKTGRT